MSGLAEVTPMFLTLLKVGDSFETEGIFQGGCSDPLTWKLKSKGAGNFRFDVSYLGGINVGQIDIEVRGSKMSCYEVYQERG